MCIRIYTVCIRTYAVTLYALCTAGGGRQGPNKVFWRRLICLALWQRSWQTQTLWSARRTRWRLGTVITQHKYAPCCLSESCNSNTLSKHCFLRYSDANLVYTSGKSCLRNRAVINNNKDSWWSDLSTTVTAIVPHSRRPPSLMRSSARRLPQPSHQRQQELAPPAPFTSLIVMRSLRYAYI